MDELRSVVARALANDPDHRYETALTFVQGLHGAFVRPSARPTPPRRRKRVADPLRPSRTPRPTPSVTPPELPLATGADTDATHVTTLSEAPPTLTTGPATEPELTAVLDPMPAPDPADRTPGDGPDEVATPLERNSSRIEEIGSLAARIDDIDLRRADEDRYSSVESAPSASDLARGSELDVPHVAGAMLTPPVSRLDQSHGEDANAPLPPPSHGYPLTAIASVPSVTPASREIPPESLGTLASAPLRENRSAVWPILLALIVGLMVGFAFGFVGGRDRNNPSAQVEAQAPPVPAPAGGDTQPPPKQTRPKAPSPAQPAPSRDGAAADTRERERQRPASVDQTAGDIGRLLVRSSPAGAKVSLDGREVGTTPLTLRDVGVGTHLVRVTHQGYIAAEQRVRISGTQPAQSIELELTDARVERPTPPAPGPAERTSGLPAVAPGAKAGSLFVDSRPTGARVLVDGKPVGTTPFLLDDVAAGDHAVSLELDGFAPWSTSAHVSGGERTRVSGSLEQK
jgi:hypothetical protein